MEKEITALLENNTWEIVSLPHGKKSILQVGLQGEV